MIDPLTFRDEMARLAKYEIGATNDEFFMPDALKVYFDIF
jgi:PhoPQ-activated pathogenicity-related protein